MSETSITPERAWNSWTSEFPAEMRHLPSGLSLGFCAYASSANAFTRFPAGADGLRLGPRGVHGDGTELELAHAGTRLRLAWQKPDPFSLVGAWETVAFGEWGLRFWVLLCLRMAPPGSGKPAEWLFNPATGDLSARAGPLHILVRGERPPLLATFHDGYEALQGELETKGYFCLDSRAERGTFVVLRYHLEEMPRFRFAVTLAHEAGLAVKHAARLLQDSPAPRARPRQQGRYAGALDAVRDVVGWNTVWDAQNGRAYTSLSRNWVAQKFGGWGVWLDDVLYHALMAGLFDMQLARENLQAVFAGATPEGNLPCLMTGRDSWVDRSQPPIGAFIVWMLHLRSGARDLLAIAWPALLRNHEWWWRRRDGNENGLLEYGTSPVGEGLYRGTKLAAKDESSMDNSPVHDEARLVEGAGTLDCEDVGLNSLVALDGEMLARIARALGHEEEADRLEERANQLKARIGQALWDGERGVFANRLWSGRFVRSLAPTSFFPLLAGAASAAQAEAMVRLLDDPAKFGGEWLLPSVTRDDPAFADNVYWRGRIWPPLNFLVWHALRRAGFEAKASELAENGYRLFMGEWAERRCAENFNAVGGAALDQPDTDPFYGWGALMPYLGVAEIVDVNPWGGFEISHGQGDALVGPVLTPAGEATVQSVGPWLKLYLGDRPVLRTTVPGRFRHVRIAPDGVRVQVPPVPEEPDTRWLELPQVPADRILLATFAGQPIAPEASESDVCMFRLPATEREETFVVMTT